jgi:hypothetical protein
MSHYYKTFYNRGPMEQITEQEANRIGVYVVEETHPIHRYKRFFEGKFDSVVYAHASSPENAIADLKSRQERVPAIIYSSPETTPAGGYKWREWHAKSDGSVEWIAEEEFRADTSPVRSSRYTPSGQLRRFTDYIYNHEDVLIELVHHDGDGNITMTEEVDP